MSDVNLRIDQNGHFAAMFKKLNEMRKENRNCDFTIKVGSELLSVHKSVLIAGSDYFEAMLSHDVIENQTGVAEMKEVDSDSLKRCIDFLYTGECSVDPGNEEKLIYVAHLLQLDKLCEAILEFLGKNLDCGRFFVSKKIADTYGYKDLGSKCDEFALDNVDDILDADKYKIVDRKYFVFLISSKSKLTDGAKCKLLLRWVNLDVENREKYFLEILDLLDMSQIPLPYHRYILEQEPFVRNSLEYSRVFTQSMLNILEVPSKNFMSSFKRDAVNSIILFNHSSAKVERFDPNTNQMSTVCEIRKSFIEFTAVAINRDLYILQQNLIFKLSHKDSGCSWIQITDIPQDHGQSPPAAVLDGCIFVVGEWEKNKLSNDVSKFDPRKKKWTTLNKKKVMCYFTSLVTNTQFLYSLGGRNRNNVCLETVERFDSQSEKWTEVSSMNKAKCAVAAVSSAQRIYVLGGFAKEQVADVEFYDELSNTWTAIVAMPDPRSGFKAFAIGDKIYVVGGKSGKQQQTIGALHLPTSRWETVFELHGVDLNDLASVAMGM